MGGKGERMLVKPKWTDRIDQSGWKEWSGTSVWNEQTGLSVRNVRIDLTGQNDQTNLSDLVGTEEEVDKMI
jgi:hypothetical protein